ncbi:hypothetical protein, partial [Coprococcus comes]|uniref:hypothetical protein n=1 Tax=Coprococcus comes TaxID=410072 RepID=UPI001A9AE773
MEAIAEHDSRPKWFIGMVCTKEFGIFIFSGGVSFTQMSLFQPDPYKNVRNPTQMVIYFDGDMLPSYRTMKYKSPIWGY